MQCGRWGMRHRVKKDCHFIKLVVMGFQKDAEGLL